MRSGRHAGTAGAVRIATDGIGRFAQSAVRRGAEGLLVAGQAQAQRDGRISQMSRIGRMPESSESGGSGRVQAGQSGVMVRTEGGQAGKRWEHWRRAIGSQGGLHILVTLLLHRFQSGPLSVRQFPFRRIRRVGSGGGGRLGAAGRRWRRRRFVSRRSRTFETGFVSVRIGRRLGGSCGHVQLFPTAVRVVLLLLGVFAGWRRFAAGFRL